MANNSDLILQAVDLRLFDRSPQELAERALLDATTKFPDWNPRAGNTEVGLIESNSLVTAEAVFAINRLGSAVTENVVTLFGIDRSDGIAATAMATFTFINTAGATVDAGTVLRLELNDETVLLFSTDEAAVADPGEATATVAITALTATEAANDMPAGTPLSPMVADTFIESVELASTVAGGSSPEDTFTFLNRAVQRFAQLGSTLTQAPQFTARVLEDARVSRAMTLDKHNGTTPANGHVAVAVAGVGGVALSSGVKAELLADLQAKAQANLIVHVIDPTITVVSVTAEVKAAEGYTAAEVKERVVEALSAYLNPDTWPWGGTVYRNELIALLDSVVGVERVVSLTDPASDTALGGVAPLADTDVVAADITVS